jgi:hypothetical protein
MRTSASLEMEVGNLYGLLYAMLELHREHKIYPESPSPLGHIDFEQDGLGATLQFTVFGTKKDRNPVKTIEFREPEDEEGRTNAAERPRSPKERRTMMAHRVTRVSLGIFPFLAALLDDEFDALEGAS